jgi:hypothetical protein
MPQFQPPPPLPHFSSSLGAPVCFVLFEFFRSFLYIHFDVLQVIKVFHTPSSGQSHPNEIHDMPRGSSGHSNHPNDDDA